MREYLKMGPGDRYDFGGDTIGIGYNPKTGLCVVTFNGIVKNSIRKHTITLTITLKIL